MPILFTLIAYEEKVLVEHVARGLEGNFAQLGRKILERLGEADTQQSFQVQEYIYNCTKSSNITYMCMTDKEFDRSSAFSFLNSLKKRFSDAYGSSAKNAISYAYNSEFIPVIEAMLDVTNAGGEEEGAEETDQLLRINSKVKELKGVMADNIGFVLRRGEKVESLVERSEVLDINAGAFRRNATALQRAMYWKNIKTYMAMSGVGAALFYIFLSTVCGGFDLPSCTG